MAGIFPVVRHFILCEDIELDSQVPSKVTLVNLIHVIKAAKHFPFPVIQKELCIFVALTECRGSGEVVVKIVEADTEELIFSTQPRVVAFGNDPLEVLGLSFRIKNCVFPAPGLYWIQFFCDNVLIARHDLVLKEN